MNRRGFEIFYRAPAIFINQVSSCLPVEFKYMYTLHAKFLNLPDKPSLLCGKLVFFIFQSSSNIGTVLLSNRSENAFDVLLKEIRKGLEEYCGDTNIYKRVIFGYDSVLERIIASVFPYFDFNTTLYYNSETRLRSILNTYYRNSHKSLSEMKTKLWLNRILCKLLVSCMNSVLTSDCVNPSTKEQLNTMLHRVFEANQLPIQDDLFANDGIIMSNYLSRWHQQNHSYLTNQIRHPNDFIREQYTKDYNEYFQWRFN